jgi:serine/threonine-protein kinase
MTLDTGSILAKRFELVREVGRGSMGTVWLATHLTLGVRCAVKFMTSEGMGHPDFAARFAFEARAIAQLNSPNIVRVLDYDVDDGVPFIAMEWLQGEDLGARIQRAGRLDPAVTYRIVSQVACGLEKAHAAGIVHRDLKPENIFLAEEDEGEIAKLLDFGIATRISFGSGGDVTRAPRARELVGTPAYMSPEQMSGVEVDHRADLWSLAVVTFECLTGQHPFRADSLPGLFAQIQRAPLRVPSLVDPSCPPELDRWWARAASPSLQARFASAPALAHALARALGVIEPSLEVQALPPRPPMRRSSLAAASVALALAPLAGMLLSGRIEGHARSRHSSAPARPPGDLGEAAGEGSLAGRSIPPSVELVGLPDLPTAAMRAPAGPMPTPAAAVQHANATRGRAPPLVPSKAARAPSSTSDPEAPSPPADDVDFGF